jgi:hypothetical protein
VSSYPQPGRTYPARDHAPLTKAPPARAKPPPEQAQRATRRARRGVVEASKDLFSLGDRERDEPRLSLLRGDQSVGGEVEAVVAEPVGQLEDVSAGNWDPREHHPSTVHLFVSSRKCPERTVLVTDGLSCRPRS